MRRFDASRAGAVMQVRQLKLCPESCHVLASGHEVRQGAARVGVVLRMYSLITGQLILNTGLYPAMV